MQNKEKLTGDDVVYDPMYENYREHRIIINRLKTIGWMLFNIFVVVLFIAVVQLFIILKFL